jgi:hypothetical protein
MTPVDLQCVLILQLIGLWYDGLMSKDDYDTACDDLQAALWYTATGDEKAAMCATADHYGLKVPDSERAA